VSAKVGEKRSSKSDRHSSKIEDKEDDKERRRVDNNKNARSHLANTRSRRSPKTPPRYPRPSTLSRTPTTLATGPIPIGGRRECPPRSFGGDCAGRSRRVRRCRRLGLGSKQLHQHHPLVVVVVVCVMTESFGMLSIARSKECVRNNKSRRRKVTRKCSKE